MHFKKLEVVGFKSFMNKTKLKFEPGVTAIVGPNGCGKSNIVDAIKWVLGEQSVKSMRSASMQDVIFNGTDKYDPLSLSEVSLTFSNVDRSLPVDYDEVTISRRLFRSGESEYLLNKTPVRLTDIRNILMGTGIGTSSYSIFEQGKMDMILSSKPEERRHVFEEAAGITRYKSKKREALLKLERTQDNLTRINDIIREVERQINSIERQARKAERYKARYEELKDLDVKLSYKKFNELNSNDNKLEAESQDLKQRTETFKVQLDQYTASLAAKREEYSSVLDELQVAQNELMRLSSDVDKNKHVVEMNAERIRELQKYVERLDWEIEQATERKEVLRERLEALESRLSDVSSRCRSKDKEFSSSEEKMKSLDGKMKTYKHELRCNREKTVDIAGQQTSSKNSIITINANIHNAQAREKRLKIERQNVQSEKDNIFEEFKAAERKAAEAERELMEKKSEFSSFREKFASNQEKLVTFNNEKQTREKRLHEIVPRREFLEKVVAEREGINESVKEIMKRLEVGDDRFKGVRGILAELIDVRQNYGESIESVFGDVAQAIVVDNRGIAEGVVRYLSENSMGSVNFVILEELKTSKSFFSGSTPDGMRDITHIIADKEPYNTALKVMLSETFVAFSSDDAAAFLESNPDFNGVVIGEKGEVFRKGVYRSKNYSARETLSLFGRRERIKKLLEEEEQITLALKSVDENIVELEKWITESSIVKERLESALREKQMDFADASVRKKNMKDRIGALSEEIMVLGNELTEEVSSLEELRREKERHEATLHELEVKSVQLQQAIEDGQKSMQDSAYQREQALFSISDIKAELSALRKEEENLVENLEREKESFRRVDEDVEDKRTRITESGNRITALDEEIKTLKAKNIEYGSMGEIKSVEIEDKKRRKDELGDAIHTEEEKAKNLDAKLEEARNKSRDVDVMEKELEYKRNSIVERVLESYKVDITDITLEFDENTDWEESSEKIIELKAQLEKMGPVSLGAVEEHKELEERFRFLTQQRDDLTKGRETLLHTITKINKTTRKMFIETFEKIKKEFNDYFRMLFNGGKGELILQDESDILECGIDISVRPPGKKVHNIMQLSGGEKAMTAIALIFALFRVNPSPFCILDEIDAPLDESNIVRFCRVLKEFLKLSQFIIITHNRMTIQLADVLYGITMEEKGVSKVVSVKFTEDKEETVEDIIPQTV